ncbi:fibronectin type III domain-containing protein [Ancylobacter vacuolatus]|uniref:Chitodextrinase n=1 Tax=Ancylobacter vacuolatus TaxID=223389 RepID=A0ABU0DCA8_9HYPH|nr:glycosyl hydrolase family 18 protein [Ancylobacter vacuolatus]MDQ0346057.1 chitodextrinase [Ancylobacter vacuolatus]
MSSVSGVTTTITWQWGTATVLAFNPAIDVLDFGWFASTNFTISEVDGDVVISIPSNNQTYRLESVQLSDLGLENITARDASALAAWQVALEAAGSGDGTDDGGDPGDTGGDSDGDGDPDGGTGGDTEAGYADAWSASDIYTGGDRVSMGNLVYQAGWWTQGEDPSAGGSVWTLVGYMDTTPVVPDAPEDLYAAGTSATTTVLVWDAAEVNGVGTVSAYQIYQDGVLIATTASTYYKVTGLEPSTAYAFSIVAIDEAGASEASEVVSVNTALEGTGGGDKTFSPYIDMSLSSSQNLVEIVEAAGLSAVTLAFVLSSGPNTLGWGGIGTIAADTLPNGTSILSQIETLQARGVEVTISLGGANGQEGALTFSSAEALAAAYQEIIDRYHVSRLDFDIEGSAIANDAANALRNEALALLQAANPELEVSFTLPVLTDGLTQDGIDLLTAAMAAGVDIAAVNIMAMDYGAYYDTGDMGNDAISAARSTLAQMETIGLDSPLVITVMIGINDVTSEVFTLEDAEQLVAFAQANDNVAGISMWSLSRDNGSATGYVSPTGSGIVQDSYAFAEILKTVADSSDSGSSDGDGDTDGGDTDTGSGDGDGGDTDEGDTGDGDGDTDTGNGNGGDDGTGTSTTTAINWAWGTDTVLAFEPSTDTLDFGWMSAQSFSVSEVGGSVVIDIAGNNQTYTLDGVTLADLSIGDITAKDTSALAEWQALLDAADDAAAETVSVASALHASDGLV